MVLDQQHCQMSHVQGPCIGVTHSMSLSIDMIASKCANPNVHCQCHDLFFMKRLPTHFNALVEGWKKLREMKHMSQ